MIRFKLVALSLSFLLCIETPITTLASNYTTSMPAIEEATSETSTDTDCNTVDSNIDSEQTSQTDSPTAPSGNDTDNTSANNSTDNTNSMTEDTTNSTEDIVTNIEASPTDDDATTTDTTVPDSDSDDIINQDTQTNKTFSIFFVKQNASTFSLKTSSIDEKNDLTKELPAKLYPGQSLLLTAAFTNQNETIESIDEKIQWTTDNGTVTFENQTAVITPAKPGNITVTASTKTQTTSYTFEITAPTLNLNFTKSTLRIGEKIKLKATATPSNSVIFTSSDSSVATISIFGNITAKKQGTAVITATANNISASCTIKVKKPTLTLDKKTLTVYLKNPTYLKATARPAKKVTWSSSNKKIATVSSSGKIKGKKTGTVTITASANGVKKSCTIKIKKPKLTLASSELNVIAGYSYKLSAKTRPSKKVTWSTSNKKIATVSSNGVITGVKPGTVTISATFSGITKTCQVTVEKNIYILNKKSKTLLVGDNVILNMPNASQDVTYDITQESSSQIVSIDTKDRSCTVTALNTGTVTITATTNPIRNGKEVTCISTCTIKVISSGVSPQQSSCPVGLTKQFSLHNAEKSETTIQSVSWSSSKTDVATINSATGLATAKKNGTSKLIATVTYADHSTKQYTSTMKVSTPTFSTANSTLALGCSYNLQLKGTNSYSDIQWSSSNPMVATATTDGTITSYKKGTTTITAIVDGKSLSCNLTISNPYLKTDYKALTKGKTTTIKVSGKKKSSTVSFSSENTAIATVSKKGVVKGKGYGNTNIIVTVDGKTLIYAVSIATQSSLTATKTAKSIMYSSSYSQPYRMSQGYYDCSSLVFRAYKKSTSLLGGSSSWAPTAAAQASYLERRGKVISYNWVDKSQLLPGDLIFYGNSPNGRYKGIFHISMYYGNGQCIEKPLRNYTYNSSNVVMIARPTK